ncbi:Condensin complex subunit 3 [Leucoagaricus sp. SymC.cos]|nr:Condensin complex subunit 3 [Leucoagaricus sp. SymC.cos]
MPGRARHADQEQQFNIQSLSSEIPKIFGQVQLSIANHQKNCVALHKIHAQAAAHQEDAGNNAVRLTGENLFREIVQLMLLRVFPLKKGVTTADRVIRFIGAYTKFINEKAAEDGEGDDSTAGRFTLRFLKFLLRGIEAKDKNVRYRVTQTLVEMVAHLGEIDEDLYSALRDALLGRAMDKEAPVRAQAVIALARLCPAEAEEDQEDDEISMIGVLLDALAHDPSSDVRRAILHNLSVTPTTIPHILNRLRDVESAIRKAVLSVVLEPNSKQGDEVKIVRDGLGDREESVRTTASSLIGSWIDCVNMSAGTKADNDPEVKQEVPEVEEGVLSLLSLFDLGQDTVAVDALLSAFTTRSDIFTRINLTVEYWKNLTPERAFLARVFVDHCLNIKDHKRLEDALPTVSQLSFVIRGAWDQWTELYDKFMEEKLIQEFSEAELQEKEDQFVDKESITAEMLKLAVNLDYGDEIGRRTMFPLIREMTASPILPEGLVGFCIDVLRKLATNEKDLIRIVVEIISDLRDPFVDEPEDPPVDPDASLAETPGATPKPLKPRKEKTEAEKKRAQEVDSRCLILSNAMLERVNSTFEENSTLEGLMKDLIIPSIPIKDARVRERAFISLGLCCSIARKRALDSVDFFRSQILSSPDRMKPSLYKIVFDMLMVHDLAFARIVPQKVYKFLIERLKEEQDPEVLATLCLGIAKLVYAGIARDINAVANLMLAFLSPATSGNQELRQCLIGFFPVYSYSSVENQNKMMGIFLQVFSEMKKAREDLEQGEEMTTPAQLANMFVDLIDPNRTGNGGQMNEKDIYENGALHLKLAIEILKEFLKPQFDFDRDDKKVLCQMFSKLYVPDAVDDALIRRLKLYIDTVKSHRPLKDTTSRNALTKFDALICKKFEKQLEFKEEELRKLEELQDLFEFLDDIIPEDDGELVDLEPKRRGRKRRSTSVASTATEGEVTSHDSSRGKKGKKRRRLSGDDDESEEEEEQGTPQPAVKKRVLPRRAATGKIPTQPIVITDSEDETQLVTTTAKAKRAANRKPTKVEEEEAVLDKDISQLLESVSAPSTPSTLSSLEDDSILGADSDEDEEDEVNGLLVGDS